MSLNILSVLPDVNSTGVILQGAVIVTFDQEIDVTTYDESSFLLSAPPETPVVPPGGLVPLTIDVLCDTIASRLYETVTAKFNFTREVCEQAQFQIRCGHLDQYQVKTVSTSLNGLVKEFCPVAVDFEGDALTVINNYADWLLGILVALRLPPQLMYTAVGAIHARAMRLDNDARYDQLLDRIGCGSQREPLNI